MTPVSVADYRELARRRLPSFLFEYIDGGSYAEVTLRRNITDPMRLPRVASAAYPMSLISCPPN